MKIMQICFSQVLNSAGGAVKVFCNMSNYLCNEHKVVNVCADAMEGTLFYKLDSKAGFINLLDGCKIKFPLHIKGKNEFVKLLNKLGLRLELPREQFVNAVVAKKMKNCINEIKPDIVICYEPRSVVALAKVGYPLEKIIAMFHMDPAKVFEYLSSSQENVLRKVKYLQVLLDSYKLFLIKKGYTNVVSIGNIVPQYDVVNHVEREKTIIHVGRLDKKHKRQHLLIEAFSKIHNKYPDWNMKFYGGDSTPVGYEEELKNSIHNNKLETQVFLMGITDNIEKELSKASIFAFPSAYEGFPLALTEAMAMGLPCIGFKTTPAVNELIKNGNNGILCEETIDALSNALEELIKAEDKRIQYGKQARVDMERYSIDMIMKLWKDLISSVVDSK